MFESKLVSQLHQQGKHVLAHRIESSKDMSVLEYSQSLWSFRQVQRPIGHSVETLEPELISAFKKEMDRVGIKLEIQEKALASLKKYNILQTTPHTGLCDGARIFSLLALSIAGSPDDGYLVVPTFSGVPFGNDSYPGALSCGPDHTFSNIFKKDSYLVREFEKKEKDRFRDNPSEIFHRASFVPKNYRDKLVYKSETPLGFWNIWNELSPEIKNLFSAEEIEQLKTGSGGENDFTRLLLVISNRLINKALDTDKLIYIDGNAVITNYLCEVLKKDDHFITKMFFDPVIHKQVMATWSHNQHFFYDVIARGETEFQTSAYIDELVLKTRYGEEELTKELLIDRLEHSKLTPGIFLTFLVLSFLNKIDCMGGFKQVTYLSEFKKVWQESNLLPHDISDVQTNLLTTGVILGDRGSPVTPIDVLFSSKFMFNPMEKMSELYERVLETLLGFKI